MTEPTAKTANVRRFAFSSLARLADWPKSSPVPPGGFCLLLLSADRSPTTEDVEQFAALAIQQGLAYLSVAGDSASWIEDVVDATFEQIALDQGLELDLITTSHENMADGLAFFDNDMVPPAGVTLHWAVAVGSNAQAQALVEEFADRHEAKRISV